MVEYKHGLSKALVRVLSKIAVQFQDTKPHQFKEMELNYNEASNFQKLKYWQLIEKIGDAEGKGGLWRMTEKGMEFVTGKTSCPKFAWTYRGDVVRHEGELVSITDISGGWKYRAEYAKESQPR